MNDHNVVGLEPTAIFHKAKRNLAIAAGFLVFVVFGGIEVRDAPSSSSVPFAIKNPNMVQHAIAIILAYCLYQLCTSWAYQRDEVRRKSRNDFIGSIAISAGALAIYGAAHRNEISAAISSSFHKFSFELILNILAAVLGIISVYSTTELRKRMRETFRIRQETLKDRLLKPGWVLLFNPQTGASKRIEFIGDGTIGQGKNDNEATWSLNQNELEILRSDGSLQNLFTYDSATDRFLCINDPNAKGIKGQIIFRQDG